MASISRHSTTFLSGTRTKRRRNFLPTLIATIFLWLILAGLVYFVDPDTILAVPAFFVLVFLGLLFTFSTIFAHSRRGFLSASGLTVFLALRYFGIGHLLNLFLILAFCLCLELYFIRSN